ncbi:DEAD/DEAH box helicase [Candidatus Symbiobacter mobilis]|uniref:DNA/RNA SNF2 family helicase n=1 Tax=Candidatus Symbiobacter mobilis CR TaxID=946483 RepID=U5N9D5_9BURK|nr:DEAD/DEAH box helicase [Candidatus Symbiobacter mobilis]AGX87920.1 DNA/RNA SNF2 family helicase [Candidatus Symbiobacter mobilis CR]
MMNVSPAGVDAVASAPFSAVPVAQPAAPAVAQGCAQTAPAQTAQGFAALHLHPSLLAAVEALGFSQPTVVQQKTIPLALTAETEPGNANDLMVSSQTGSGKTAAFLLPVLHSMLGRPPKADSQAGSRRNQRPFREVVAPTALIVCPTRELAQQVAADAIDLLQCARGIHVACIVGGTPYALQLRALRNVDLLIATPGRLLDLHRSGKLQLDAVQCLVVDEADRMLDLGFCDDLAQIHELTRTRRQTMMFSATFAPRIEQLAARVMRSPRRIATATPQEQHANIQQCLYWADDAQHKRKLLDHWLRDESIDQAIVFASTQIECDELAYALQQDGFDAVALHGALGQGLRNRRMTAMREGKVQILVATDVAARGLDVPTVTHVFNFGLPMKAEDYVHRVGRTGRAGRDGLAVTFAEFRDRRKIGDIEAYRKQPLEARTVPGLEPRQRVAPPRGPGRFPPRGADVHNRGFARPQERSHGRTQMRRDDFAPANRAGRKPQAIRHP